MGKQEDIEALLKKLDESKQNKLDLSRDEDLSIAIMNLVSIEEHFFFTGAKIGNSKYFDLINEAREIRKELLKKIVKEPEGEVWCISKHLLAASMRLMEVGTKTLSAGNKKEAQDYFAKAYDLYALFWGVNMKVVDSKDLRKIDEKSLSVHDTKKKGFLGKLGDLVRRAVDCCIE